VGDDLHLLDAKYRVDRRDGVSLPEHDDVKAMHAYRDAIRGRDRCRVGWATIVYPGKQRKVWLEPGGAFGGVAAVHWSPGQDAAVQEWIDGLLTGQQLPEEALAT